MTTRLDSGDCRPSKVKREPRRKVASANGTFYEHNDDDDDLSNVGFMLKHKYPK